VGKQAGTFFQEEDMPGQATAVSPRALIDAAKAPILAYNEKSWDDLPALVTADFVYDEVSTGRKAQGLDAILPLWQGWAQAFPDSRATFHDAFASESSVLLEMTWTGTHTGPMQAPSGPIPPTGKSIALRACMVIEMEGERVKRERHYFDMATLFQQLGLNG
jgi:steroid delta-isomerase-like uncharacterized protein